MIKKINNKLGGVGKWYDSNIAKLFLLVILHSIVFFAIQLPYINVVILFFPAILYFVDIVTIVILFNPDRKYLLYITLILFAINIPLEILGLKMVTELLGNISYILLVMYLIKLFIYKKLK